jgi:hypothetical protein
MERTRKEMDKAGIETLGHLTQAEVAKLYRRAAILACPTEFAEIDCQFAQPRDGIKSYEDDYTNDFLTSECSNEKKDDEISGRDISDWTLHH